MFDEEIVKLVSDRTDDAGRGFPSPDHPDEAKAFAGVAR